MTMIIFPVVISGFCYSSLVQAGPSLVNMKQVLFDELFTNYSKKVAPQNNITDVVDFNVTFHLRNILSLDEESETLTSSGWLEIVWYDFRLSWLEGSYGGVTTIYTSRDDVWIPDVTVDNTASQYKVVGQPDDTLMISSNGLVQWTPGDVFHTRCSMNIAYFPFDEQTCEIELVTWTYQLDTARFGSLTAPMSSLLEEHGEWKVTNIKVVDDYHHHTVSAVLVTIDIQRQSTFQILNIVLPVITETFINALVFILPAESGEKITLSTALFLSYAVLLSYITDHMPNTSTSVSILGVFVAAQLVLSALSIFSTVVILKLYHKGKKDDHPQPREVPASAQGMCQKLNLIFFVLFFVLGFGACASLLLMLKVKIF